MFREYAFLISVGGVSSHNRSSLSFNTRDNDDLEADAVEQRANAAAQALKAMLLHNTWITGVRITDKFEDDGTQLKGQGNSISLELQVHGTRRAPVNGGDEPVPLPSFIAVQCVRNAKRRRPGLFEVRGALTEEDITTTANREFDFPVGSTTRADMNAALNAVGVALGGELYMLPNGTLEGKKINSMTVRGIVDNDDTKRRESIETARRKLALREAKRLVKEAIAIYNEIGSPAFLINDVPAALTQIVADLRALIAKYGPEILRDILKLMPGWLKRLFE